MYLAMVLSIVLACCQTNAWNGIVPLKSTRADVEKILGVPMSHSIGKHAGGYKTENERVDVLYSTGPCKIKPGGGWNVPELVVTSIDIYPNVRPKIADLNLDEKKFEKTLDPEILHQMYYTNTKDGIGLTVDTSDGTIVRFSYFPESKNAHLKCKK